MPANDREVFEYLTVDLDTQIEIDLLTFAIFAHERREWCRLFEEQNNKPPTQAEVDVWVSQITEWRFGQMRDEAVRFFDKAARAYLGDEIEAYKTAVFQDTIVREVKVAGGFWRQLFLALMAAILAPLIIGSIIAIAIVYDKFYPTIGSVSERLGDPAGISKGARLDHDGPLPKSN
jgi:hypothetical protein